MGNLKSILSIQGLSKSFGGVHALRDVSLSVEPGRIHGLLGENGSGKSTLIKCLAGFHAPDGGDVQINGNPVSLPFQPGEARGLGLEFVHQDLGLISTLSVAENLFLTEIARPSQRYYMSPAHLVRRSRQTFAKYDLDHIDATHLVSEIRPVDRALLAIVRAMEGMTSADGGGPQLLILDEPTVFLPEQEVNVLFSLLHRIRDSGSSVLYVSHDLDEVVSLTDDVTVLRDGKLAGTLETRTVSKDAIIELIIGRRLAVRDAKVSGPEVSEQAPAVSVRDLATARLTDVSIDVMPGEVLGLTGLVGSGYDDVLYALFGATNVIHGSFEVEGTDANLMSLSPAIAISRRIALVPSDRHELGSVLDLSAEENIGLLTLDRRTTRLGAVDRKTQRSFATDLMHQYGVRPPVASMQFGAFSGGNQQRIMLAKWLGTEPRLILLDEPTQGVDIGAREEIWKIVRAAAAQAAVICASSDYEELATLCDRVMVVANGTIAGSLSGPQLTKERLSEYCLRAERSTSGETQEHAIGSTGGD